MADNEIQANGNHEPDIPSITPEQVKLIIDTWAMVTPDLQGAGTILFHKLFEIAPHLKELFSFDEDDSEEFEAGLKKHGLQVMESIDKAISLINEPEELTEELIDLGIIHNMKNVKVESFGPVGEALVYTLKTGLQDKFTPKVQDAWVTLYTIVQYFMSKGMDDGLEA